jgi:hypothetical protein
MIDIIISNIYSLSREKNYIDKQLYNNAVYNIIYDAICSNNLEILDETLMRLKINHNISESNITFLVMDAIINNNIHILDIILMLVKPKLNITIPDTKIFNIIKCAIKHCNVNILNKILTVKSIQIDNYYIPNFIKIAIKTNNIEILNIVLTMITDCTNISKYSIFKLIHYAIKSNSYIILDSVLITLKIIDLINLNSYVHDIMVAAFESDYIEILNRILTLIPMNYMSRKTIKSIFEIAISCMKKDHCIEKLNNILKLSNIDFKFHLDLSILNKILDYNMNKEDAFINNSINIIFKNSLILCENNIILNIFNTILGLINLEIIDCNFYNKLCNLILKSEQIAYDHNFSINHENYINILIIINSFSHYNIELYKIVCKIYKNNITKNI